jgi:hypothetical protein
MLADAILTIHRANDEALRRRLMQRARRHPVSLVDRWLGEVETLVEANQPAVPEPLVKEISGFLQRLDGRLYLRLRRNRQRSSLKVLDVLFDAEAQLL